MTTSEKNCIAHRRENVDSSVPPLHPRACSTWWWGAALTDFRGKGLELRLGASTRAPSRPRKTLCFCCPWSLLASWAEENNTAQCCIHASKKDRRFNSECAERCQIWSHTSSLLGKHTSPFLSRSLICKQIKIYTITYITVHICLLIMPQATDTV